MSKARTLADFISDGGDFADGSISVSEVSGAAPLASPTFTGTASGTFSGPLTGNVTGNVTGDLTGDVTGNVTGNLTGNVTGDVAGELDLNALAATIADTAVDIFVYDTRKDSDGGAWRKRTQHTSWYNETLNTATRGSRKEFPAVAVIVADSSRNVTIYDGDDPDLPMWMVFNSGSGTWIICTTGGLSLSMLNGVMSVGCNGSNQRFRTIDFIKERHREYSHTDGQYSLPTGIVTRNSAINGSYESGTVGLINRTINDVAMTVLPNAPIDAATGLPVPTIAVATNGGVSVIKDDGTVQNQLTSSSYLPIKTLGFTDDNLIVVQTGYNGSAHSTAILSSTGSSILDVYWYNQFPHISEYTTKAIPTKGKIIALDRLGGNAGNGNNHYACLAYLDHTTNGSGSTVTTHPKSMVAGITSDYNTGWMNGDIKLATLSDTDDTNVTGSELVTNGDFSNGTTGWTAYNGASISVVSNKLRVTGNGVNTYPGVYQTMTTVVGKRYTVSYDIGTITNASALNFIVRASHGGSNIVVQNSSANTSYGITFTATSTTTTFDIEAIVTASLIFDIDNVTLRLAEEDRSVNGNGLQVFGTVTKTPVATGADLVAYSGFSTSDYLEQPVNADLNWGSGDYCIMGWLKSSSWSAAQGFWETGVGSDGLGDPSILGYLDTSGNLAYYTRHTSGDWVNISTPFSANVWHHVAFVYRNGIKHLYLDGELKQTQSHSGTFSNANTFFRVGHRADNASSAATNSSLALVRISRTPPSPEQIKKIYEDEKVLFQENAQATLYGSSDAVTALAYDDSTELLHVGTSAGRSVFQGLRRVDNTTTAVGAAISASNGLVADE